MTEDLPDRNALARQLADVRDEMAELRKQLLEAQQTAAMWQQWAEAHADEISTSYEDDKYEDMLTAAQHALEKVKDYNYDVGYATALKELRNHWYDAMDEWAEKMGVGEIFRTP